MWGIGQVSTWRSVSPDDHVEVAEHESNESPFAVLFRPCLKYFALWPDQVLLIRQQKVHHDF
jgi:hypothetical protein